MVTPTIRTIGQLKVAIKNLKDDAKFFISEDNLLYSYLKKPVEEDKETTIYEIVVDNIGYVHNPTVANNDGELY